MGILIMKKIVIAFSLLLLPFNLMAKDNNNSERWVIAGGSITELVYAIGAGNKVVGVDETTSYPEQTQALPHIGYWKQLSTEGILSLRPSTFVTWDDAEPKMVLRQLAQHNVKVISLPRTPATFELMLKNIRTLAISLDKQKEAEALIDSLQSRLAEINAKNNQIKQKVKVMFFLSPGGGIPQVAGKTSVADAILHLAGGENIATHENYRIYSAEAIIAANPELIVITTQSQKTQADGLRAFEGLASVPGVSMTQAWKNQRIIEIDQSLILGMGPRIVDAVELLHQQFYPADPVNDNK
ncbi:ABC transporter substrate-binding protein [Proteus cibarius]|nr:hemin ABC transporter substrate-binding protein [Proteus vulgaris]MBG2836201.1 ABC transporter substrate-binding protein [Proteus terrae subsp. cibarius]MBG2867155.1 ABC transporter substrate-binding protein [Proteus terrae subsp. cibarius]MBJ2108029.1 ABC transporter substrate-binding protein [Proteus terrae]MBJ2131901.1 ABC transporter substrate-binding protein [Proteus terrae]